jgi:tRNA threonylcarbamoyladenosine biosynthesis protein TsaB
MNVLAFDTCLSACSVAVLTSAREARSGAVAPAITGRYQEMARGHAEALMPMIGAAMGEAGLAYANLNRIAVTVGPGTFTGVRIGIAAARGLALAIGCPVVSLTSFAALAWAAQGKDNAPGALAVCIDARREEVYVQVLATPDQALSAPAVLPVEDAARLHQGMALTAIGSGAQRLVEAAARQGRIIRLGNAPELPDAAAFIEIAAGLTPSATPPSPLYLRPADAKPQLGKSLPRVPR